MIRNRRISHKFPKMDKKLTKMKMLLKQMRVPGWMWMKIKMTRIVFQVLQVIF